MQMPGANVLPVPVLVPLIAWRLYSRIRRSIGRQPLAQQSPADFAASPLTPGIFALLAGYYVAYATGLVRWRASVDRECPASIGVR
jgi:hypothetical protein